MKTKLTKQEKNWILYDVGNSAFTLLAATILPIYFNYIAGKQGLSDVQYLAYWGYAVSIATLLTALAGPVFEIGRATIISSQNKRITRIILAFLASLLTISINPIGMILWDFINWRHINSFAHYFTKAYWIIILIHMLLFWLGEEIGYQNSKEND